MQWQRFSPKTKGPTIHWWSSSDLIGEKQVERIWQEVPHQEPITLEIVEITGERSLDFFLAKLREAEHKFKGSYVRMSNFLLNWPSKYLDETPDMRQRVMDALISRGLVELYNNAADGVLAIRSVHLK